MRDSSRGSRRTSAPPRPCSTRARISRYPPHMRGRRHKDFGQEEVFVVLDGTVTVLLGEPPERVDLPRIAFFQWRWELLSNFVTRRTTRLRCLRMGRHLSQISPSSSKTSPNSRPTRLITADASTSRRSIDEFGRAFPE